MWFNCTRFVDEAGVSVDELLQLAGTKTNLHGMQRWRYVTVEQDGSVRATPKGMKARAIWGPLFDEIEGRWEERFGSRELEHLRESLWEVLKQIPYELPDCLPILGYALFSKVLKLQRRSAERRTPDCADLARAAGVCSRV